MYKATKLYVDDNGVFTVAPADATDHHVLNIERVILGQRIAVMYATAAPPKGLNWKGTKEWASGLKVGGFTDWEATEVVPAVLAFDYTRTEEPFIAPDLLPNHVSKVIWTGTEDLTLPRGDAFYVDASNGLVYRYVQYGLRLSALACRPGLVIEG